MSSPAMTEEIVLAILGPFDRNALLVLCLRRLFHSRHSGTRPKGAGPESITTVLGYGFRARGLKPAPRNDGSNCRSQGASAGRGTACFLDSRRPRARNPKGPRTR